jgi:7-carboxy-7-deazaguanine synthase
VNQRAGTPGAPTLLVSEIFHSIQGESTWAGLPMVFVRLAGCPLHCTYCDTRYAQEEGRSMGLDEVLGRVESYRYPLVEVTGGEPLAQGACPELLRRLCEAGKTVLLETSGAYSLAQVDRRVCVILDIKTPGSGQAEHCRWENLEWLRPERDEIKFVVTGREDYQWAREQIAARELARRAKAVLFSPAFGQVESAALAQWILDDRLPPPVRLQLQIHKHIWPDQPRGR